MSHCGYILLCVPAVIDLSQFSPEQLMETHRLDIIPACPHVRPPTPPLPEAKAKRP